MTNTPVRPTYPVLTPQERQLGVARTCEYCDGNGYVNSYVNGYINVTRNCSLCNGKGYVVRFTEAALLSILDDRMSRLPLIEARKT